MINWTKVSDNEKVISLIKEREKLEEQINLIDKTALIKYELELLQRGNFISVSEQDPPPNIELLAKDPRGKIHLCSWRPRYYIFSCQSKGEESCDWYWKLI